MGVGVGGWRRDERQREYGRDKEGCREARKDENEDGGDVR